MKVCTKKKIGYTVHHDSTQYCEYADSSGYLTEYQYCCAVNVSASLQKQKGNMANTVLGRLFRHFQLQHHLGAHYTNNFLQVQHSYLCLLTSYPCTQSDFSYFEEALCSLRTPLVSRVYKLLESNFHGILHPQNLPLRKLSHENCGLASTIYVLTVFYLYGYGCLYTCICS